VENRCGGDRTEAFSDGVLAIAITLLVLDLAVPERELEQSWHAILHQWPAYLAYITSFATIGGIWLAHHGIFRRIRYVDSRVMRLNLLLLLGVSFLPFPTRLAGSRGLPRPGRRALTGGCEPCPPHAVTWIDGEDGKLVGAPAAASVACACQTGEPVVGGATAPSFAPHEPPLVAPYVITACPPGGSVSAETRIV